MSRAVAIDISALQQIARGDLSVLERENARFRRAIVDNDEAAKLDNQPPAAQEDEVPQDREDASRARSAAE